MGLFLFNPDNHKEPFIVHPLHSLQVKKEAGRHEDRDNILLVKVQDVDDFRYTVTDKLVYNRWL